MMRERMKAQAWISVRLIPVALVIGALATSLTLDSAAAVSITNRDEQDHKITVIEGDKQSSSVLKALGILADICLKGCVVRINDSENDEYELEGTEVVSIEDGYLYYDGPDASTEPSAAEVPKDVGKPTVKPPVSEPPKTLTPPSAPKG